MQILDAILEAPYRVTARHLLIVGAVVLLLSPLLTPFTCHVGAELKEPSIVPIDMELRSKSRIPDFLIRMPRYGPGSGRRGRALVSIEECPATDSAMGRPVWQITERVGNDGWLRWRRPGTTFESRDLYLLPYGEIPEGWSEVMRAERLRDGIPYVIRLDLDGRFGGRAFFVREGGSLHYGPFYSRATTKESCDWFARSEGAWRRA